MILSRLLNSNLLYKQGIIAVILTYSVWAGATTAEEKGVNYKYPKQYIGSVIANMMVEYDSPFVLYPYEPNYLLVSYASHINKGPIESYKWSKNAQKVENKFQISLGVPIWRGILGDNSLLGASYTQRSWWQAYNHKQSSPFRETNYEPQLFLAWLTDWRFGDWTIREVEVGYNHQSNGRSEPTSRSWNRGYMRVLAVNGNFLAEVKPWFRFNESGKSDDNPDITKYMGYYRAKIGYQWNDSVFSVSGNYNWNTGYGGVEAGWSYPLSKNVRFYTQVFSGYGESLIDYNHNQSIRVGAGIMLNDLF